MIKQKINSMDGIQIDLKWYKQQDKDQNLGIFWIGGFVGSKLDLGQMVRKFFFFISCYLVVSE